MPFKFTNLGTGGVVLIEPGVFGDNRGYFMETFKQSEFERAGIRFAPVQGNHSKSTRGVLRGLHFQTYSHAQGKLVRAVQGSVFDVAVDMRKGFSQFGRWVSAELSERNKKILFVPRGFAHGFLSLEDETEVEYLVDNEYSKDSEAGVIWNDSTIGVKWPIPNPVLSEKDGKWPKLDVAQHFL